MAISLGSHIILSCVGVALPTIIYLAHRRGIRHNDLDALILARRWSKVAAVLFAVGAVSGTVLSFEMGLLWPGLMGRFGDVMGLPFALEGIFFFLEAIFLGIYLYGWKGLPARVHLALLVPIAISGVGGTFCILSVNGWMNDPAGFNMAEWTRHRRVVDVDVWAAMFNRGVRTEFLHMLPATYVVTGLLFASSYAFGWLRGRHDRLHRLGIIIPLTVAAIAAPLQVITGDLAVRYVAAEQPTKLAAMELLTTTRAGQPMTVGGWLINGEVRGAIEIPRALSFALHFDRDATVEGLDRTPKALQPPANVVHFAFDLMVGLGTAFCGLALWLWLVRRRARRRGERDMGAALDGERRATKWLVRAVAIAGPLSVVALEAGWTVTEVGRQPWIARHVLLVADAVTPRGGLNLIMWILIAIYTGLAASTWFVLRRMHGKWKRGEEVAAPYELGASAPIEAGTP